ncbi:MAG: hypothetical protein ACMG6S_13580 [Byssovorax sp.]
MKPFVHEIPICALACAAAFLTSTCTPPDGKVDVYLVVEPAARQPVSTALGTIVVLQQRGGKFLRMKTQAGTFQLPSDSPNAKARNRACVPALPDDELGYYAVIPADGECLLSVELLGEGPDCTGSVIKNKITPVSTTRTAVDATSAGGAGGASTGTGIGGAGGAGGATATAATSTGTGMGGAGGK